MNQPDSLPEADRQPPRVGHETKDVNPAYVAMFGLGLFAIVAAVLALLGWMFHAMELAAERSDPPQSPVADSQTPPAPRLQTNPAADLAQMRTADQQALSSYEWIDRKHERVRIPVDRAIELLAERGFPEPPPPPPPPPAAAQQPQQPTQHQPPGASQAQAAEDLPRKPAGAREPAPEEPQEQRQQQPLTRPPAVPPGESGR